MRPQIFLTTLTLTLGLSFGTQAATVTKYLPLEHFQTTEISGLNIIAPPPARTHMLVLKCPAQDNYYRGSRVSVLDIGGAAGDNQKMDTALVTGHGLIGPDGKLAANCYVQDFSGRTAPVMSMRLADNYRAGTGTDWGLIQFPRMATPSLIRYSVRAAGIELLEAGADDAGKVTRFASARGRPENGQSCKILPRRHAGLQGEGYSGILAHNCKAIGGQSGAPLSSAQDELLGIHLGTTWTVRSSFTGRPARHGYLRSLDAAMAEDIRRMSQNMPQAKALQNLANPQHTKD